MSRISVWLVVALRATSFAAGAVADAKVDSKAACGPNDEHCKGALDLDLDLDLDDAFVALQVHQVVSSGSTRTYPGAPAIASEPKAAPAPPPAQAATDLKQTLIPPQAKLIPAVSPLIPSAEFVDTGHSTGASRSAATSGTWTAFSSDCTSCFPRQGDRAHLRSPCNQNPNNIPLPPPEAQQTANCPFLGTLTNEGVIPYDWIINETLWRAASYAGSDTNGHNMLPGVEGAFAGNFRDHSLWLDKTNKVTDLNGQDVECRYWYVKPTKMEGLSNEHSSSVGISDCPTDWANCAFDCSSAGEWVCQPLDTPQQTFADCKAKLPNVDKFEQFVKTVTKTDAIDEEGYMTTCELAAFGSTVDLVHAMEAKSGSVEDFHFFTPVESFGSNCDHSFKDEDGTFLQQISEGTGGHIGGSIIGGYKDLVQYFGELDPNDPNRQCEDGEQFFAIKIKDLRRIDIERKLPCSFDRAKLFEWMHEHNGVTDRRKDQSGWFLSCR